MSIFYQGWTLVWKNILHLMTRMHIRYWVAPETHNWVDAKYIT